MAAPDHLAWSVLGYIADMDTSAFHTAACDGPGRPAWDPDLLLALLAYSYCLGRRSSRDIEDACRTDIAYRVICGGQPPDHSTISRFRKAHLDQMEDLFVEVLLLCHAEGLCEADVVAIDGSKMAANASLQANRTVKAIAKFTAELTAKIEAVQAEQQLGQPSQDPLPGQDSDSQHGGRSGRRLAVPRQRLERLRQAAVQLEAQAAQVAAANAERAVKAAEAAAAGRKLTGRRPKGQAGVAAAQADLAAEQTKAADRTVAWDSAQAARLVAGQRPARRVPDFDAPVRKAEQRLAAAGHAAAKQAAEAKQDQANVTDPDTRPMKSIHGWVQGLNAQAAVNRNQIVLAAEVTQDAFDVAQLLP